MLTSLQFTTLGDENGLGGFAGGVAVGADLLHQLQTLHHVAEDAREAAHLLQDDAELRAHHAQVVMALLRAPHAHCAADRQQLRVVRHEIAVLENRPAAASIVQLKVTWNNTNTIRHKSNLAILQSLPVMTLSPSQH